MSECVSHLSDAVVGEAVGGATKVASDTASGGKGDEAGLGGGRAGETLEALEVDDETSNVRRGHGGTGDGAGSGVAANPGGQNVGARGEDGDASTPVGVGGNGPGRVDGTDGNGAGSGSGRDVGNVLVLVTGSDDADDALGRGSVDGVVESGREATAEGQVHDGSGGACLGADVVGSPVEARENDGGRGGVSDEDLDGDDVGALGHTVGGTTDGTGDVSAVTTGVSVSTTSRVGAESGTATELRVPNLDTTVNNVGVSSLAGAVIVAVGG